MQGPSLFPANPASSASAAPGTRSPLFGKIQTPARDTVRFAGKHKESAEEGPGLGERLLAGGKEALKSAFSIPRLMVDTLWAGLFFAISAAVTAGPGGLIAAPFIPVIIATSAAVRGVFGFIRGYSGGNSDLDA